MKTLEDFELPNDGEISLCEIDGRTHSMNYNYANLKTFTTAVEMFPKVHITRDVLHPISSRDEGGALFLPVNISFLKQLAQVYWEQGFLEALQTVTTHQSTLVSKTVMLSLDFLKYVRKVQLVFNPNIRCSLPILINQISQTRNWSSNTIRSLFWHPHCQKVAVITCDDFVRIYSCDTNAVTLLRYKEQKSVTCVAWRPLSNTEIAIGHENGIIIWNIDPSSLVTRPSISNAVILQRLAHKPIMSLAWSPKGDKLVSVAACDISILVWDVELNKTSYLNMPGGYGNILVKWSQTGEKLFSCTTGLIFRVWDCRNWESERWTILNGRVQTACWSNCGTTLVFATNTETMIYAVVVKNDLIAGFDSSLTQAIPMFDVSKVDIDGVIVGGLIQCMESDPKGKHIAVLFQDTDCVAVFNTERQTGFQIIPSSLVMGMVEETPSTISFLQKFEPGACLTIGWSSGRIQYYPIICTDLTYNSNNISFRNTSLYNSFNVSNF